MHTIYSHASYLTRTGEASTLFPENGREPSDSLAVAIVVQMPDDGKEHMVGVALDAHGKTLAYGLLSTGTVDSCMLYPRDLYQWALTIPCVRFVGVAHNHPSGDTTPSKPDIKATHTVAQSGAMLGIDLMWSLVVTHANSTWAIVPGVKQKATGDDGGKTSTVKGEDETEGEGEGEGDKDEGDDGENEGETNSDDKDKRVEAGGNAISTTRLDTTTDQLKTAIGNLLQRKGRA